MQRLLITGVTGFIGSEVLARLVKDERTSKITVVARKKPDTQKSLLANRFREHGIDTTRIDAIDWIEVPFEDKDRFRHALETLPRQDNWRVLHMAAIIKASGDNTAVERLNLGVTQDILNFANDRAAPFYYMSSVVAFGSSEHKKVRNESDLDSWEKHNAIYPYYATKRAAHEWILRNSKVPGWLFCPSVVHGSLEGSKNSRGHLRDLREGKLTWAPSGGANFVALADVAGPIAETVLSGLLDGKTPRSRLLVGPNLRLVDYFNLYLDTYHEYLEKTAPGLQAATHTEITSLPSWAGKIACAGSNLLGTLGFEIGFLSSLAQSTRYLYFESRYREGAALPSLDELKAALRSSFENP
ncbi:MAG: SDR family oxidoreductase [Bdellovibrionota bacterium]